MVEKIDKCELVENGVTVTTKVYVDVNREYSIEQGKKKNLILKTYSEATQRNILINAVSSLADSLNINTPAIEELNKLKSFIENV